jgi:hypothetical protein
MGGECTPRAPPRRESELNFVPPSASPRETEPCGDDGGDADQRPQGRKATCVGRDPRLDHRFFDRHFCIPWQAALGTEEPWKAGEKWHDDLAAHDRDLSTKMIATTASQNCGVATSATRVQHHIGR